MQNVTVQKEALLAALRTNRAEHRNLFEKAQEVFRSEIIKALDRRLKDARGGGRISTYIDLVEPQDYTESFDRAIQMVEWSVGDTIELSERDFQRYVLNDWEWSGAFAKNTMTYVTS